MWKGNSWNELDNKHKRQVDRGFVSCDEGYERDYLKSKYSWCKDFDKCWEKCCSKVKTPRPRDEFEECLNNCCT